jgi:hypothetical protein
MTCGGTRLRGPNAVATRASVGVAKHLHRCGYVYKPGENLAPTPQSAAPSRSRISRLRSRSPISHLPTSAPPRIPPPLVLPQSAASSSTPLSPNQ